MNPIQVRPFWMMTSGFVLLGGITLITFFASGVKDWVYFGKGIPLLCSSMYNIQKLKINFHGVNPRISCYIFQMKG